MCVVQIYTIHGYLNGEGMPLVWALLPNKTTETYVELFSALRDALLTTFGTIGNVTTVLTDFERAAINALSQVFPTVTVKGCSFHFRQAMMRRIQREGLKAAYEVDESAVRVWLRRIMAMTMLPAFAIPLMWEHEISTEVGRFADRRQVIVVRGIRRQYLDRRRVSSVHVEPLRQSRSLDYEPC